MAQQIILDLPEALYTRLAQTARSTGQSVESVMLRAVQVGSPPDWQDVPAEFQADLAALDRLNDEALWQLARAQEGVTERYQHLLDKQGDGTGLSSDEKLELAALRHQADAFMLRKAQAAALLRWRGHKLPPADAP